MKAETSMQWAEICRLEALTVSLCWRCSQPQGFYASLCKHCGAINPNVDLDGALAQQLQPELPA
jgi:hypothetical protein